MAAGIDLSHIEHAFGYIFTNKQLLKSALIAPGADENNNQGNRLLARVGQAAVEMVIAQNGYESSATTATIHGERDLIDSKAQLAVVAGKIGVGAYIKPCPRSGYPSAHVQSQAIRAVIGAAWEDSSQSLTAVSRIMSKLRTDYLSGFEAACVSQEPPTSSISNTGRSSDSTPEAWMTCTDNVASFQDDIVPSVSTRLLQFSSETEVLDNLCITPMLDSATGTVYPDEILAAGSYMIPEAIQFEAYTTAPQSLSMNDCWDFDRAATARGSGEKAVTRLASSFSSSSSTNSLHIQNRGAIQTPQRELSSGSNKRSKTAAGLLNPVKRRRAKKDQTQARWLECYMLQEKARCQKHNTSTPSDTYLTPDTLTEVTDFGGSQGSDLLKLLVGICNPPSVVTLRFVLQRLREREWGSTNHMPLHGLSALERIKAIEREECNVAEATMLKRCHVWRLWQEHCSSEDTSTTASCEWITYSGPSPNPNCPGNPRLIQKSQVTLALMHKIYPELSKASPTFNLKYEQVKRSEKLGRRLSAMTGSYGVGILGLLPCSESDTVFSGILDPIILQLTDDNFRLFLSVLRRTQHDFIASCSQSLEPVIRCVLDGTLRKAQLFPFEQNTVQPILEMPKGSQSMLDALHHKIDADE